MPNPQQQSPPDGYSQKATEVSLVDREQALAWTAILTLPDGKTLLAAQKMEAEARKLVAALHPETATEAEMRCALATWRHARNLFTEMSTFVAGVTKRIEAQDSSKQKALDKSAESGTMASV